MCRILTDGEDGQHMSVTVLGTERRYIWQGCYPIIQVWPKELISDLHLSLALQIQFVFSGPAGPPVEPVTQHSANTQPLCLQCCIMSLIKFIFSTSEKLMVFLQFISKGQNRTYVFFVILVFVFLIDKHPWNPQAQEHQPASGQSCSPVPLFCRAKEESLSQKWLLQAKQGKVLPEWSLTFPDFQFQGLPLSPRLCDP